MFKTKKWQSKTAALMALAISLAAGAPLVQMQSANAQWNAPPTRPKNGQQNPSPSRPTNGRWNAPPNSSNASLPYGTEIRVRYDDAEKILVLPDETAPLTLKVAQNIKSSTGTILIPVGSQIIGELRPANGGSQFVAKELLMGRNSRPIPLNARSEVVTKTEKIDKGVSTGNILKGAAIGAAAATAISAITGDRAIATEEVLGGAGVGALGGLLLGRKKDTVVVINPNTDLDLTLRSELALR
ncbi:hypothetical protein [Microcoleus sp. FACHB-672]|uniref:hypothetical protein n=1 Tax=Microcoleus sp. FACHB-672 TaxID=2692825 RepID=UPI0016835640|nr:hypothetical protein [Microcoleus sp. FACHB-672]MBD2040722.1 hypothetical protein [Microcoleus sp. FACHB-672]